MFVFAHLVCGLLLGLVFCFIIHDRRAIPVCIVSSLLPDLVDKPLAIMIPALSSGRTIFHSLLIVLIVAIIASIILRNRYFLWGIAVASCIFLHQVLDAMWLLPVSWAFPLLGPFPLLATQDYTGYYLWLEITNPSEWVYLLVMVVLLIGIFSNGQVIPDARHFLWVMTTVLVAGMGILMTGYGVSGSGNTFFAPSYSDLTTCMAGILALAAAAVMLQWHRLYPLKKRSR
jgi:hypothetical protein